MKLTRVFTIERPGRKPVEERWEWLDMFCPACGKQGIWHPELDPGDYYVGETHLCVECGAGFTIQRNSGIDGWDAPILAKLRS